MGFECMYTNRNPTGGGGGGGHDAPTPLFVDLHGVTHTRMHWHIQESCNGGSKACTGID